MNSRAVEYAEGDKRPVTKTMAEQCTILLIEDEPKEADGLMRGLRRAKFTGGFAVARDGVEALDYIEGRGQFTNRFEFPLPDLILLDLSLPTICGIEVLAQLKRRPEIAKIPVLVLLGDPLEAAAADAQRLGAAACFVKPLNAEQTTALVGALQGE